jgi:hypothetical protein
MVEGNYHYFTITDPQKRTIRAALFKDRVIYHTIWNNDASENV